MQHSNTLLLDQPYILMATKYYNNVTNGIIKFRVKARRNILDPKVFSRLKFDLTGLWEGCPNCLLGIGSTSTITYFAASNAFTVENVPSSLISVDCD